MLKNIDTYCFTFGGLDSDETLLQCVINEVVEETGIVVDVKKQFLTIEEYYEDWKFVSHYFICEAIGKCERKFTKNEIKQSFVVKWLDLQKAKNIFQSINLMLLLVKKKGHISKRILCFS